MTPDDNDDKVELVERVARALREHSLTTTMGNQEGGYGPP